MLKFWKKYDTEIEEWDIKKWLIELETALRTLDTNTRAWKQFLKDIEKRKKELEKLLK